MYIYILNLTVDCQLGPWTACDGHCGFAGKTRFFGKWPKIEHKGDKCSKGDTWQKCGNLPPCAGDYICIVIIHHNFLQNY